MIGLQTFSIGHCGSTAITLRFDGSGAVSPSRLPLFFPSAVLPDYRQLGKEARDYPTRLIAKNHTTTKTAPSSGPTVDGVRRTGSLSGICGASGQAAGCGFRGK